MQPHSGCDREARHMSPKPAIHSSSHHASSARRRAVQRWTSRLLPLRLLPLRLLPLLLCLWPLGCDSGNPVVPTTPKAPGSGEGFKITLSSQPAELVAGSGVPGTLTIDVRRVSDNQPVAEGTLVTVSTDAGNFGVNGQGEITTTTVVVEGQVAITSLFPAEMLGTATVLAQVGASVGELTVPFVEDVPGPFFVTAVQPGSGQALGGDQVRVLGGGFRQPLTVAFGNRQAQILSVGGQSITVLTPASEMPVPVGASLAVDVVVTRDLDTEPQMATLTGGFVYSGGGSVFLTEVVPNAGGAVGGERVSVLGGGFQTPLQVDFGGQAGVDPALVSSGEIRVTVPTPASPVAVGQSLTVDVQVSSGLDQPTPGVALLAGGYTYVGGEGVQVVSLNPAQGSFEGGTTVTVNGRGFSSPVAVELAGIRQLDEAFLSDTQITFTTVGTGVDMCPTSGQLPQVGVKVTNISSGEVGEAALTFTYQVPVPKIDRVAPSVGPQLGNTTVSVEGEDFDAPTRVVFIIGMEEFAASVQSTTESVVRVTLPSLPDGLFEEVDCVTADERAGLRYVPLTADVSLTNQQTGCGDVFANGFTFEPTDNSCRPLPDDGGM